MTLSAGLLNIANAGALGTGLLTLAGGTINNTFGAPLPLSTANPQTWSGSFGFTGTNSLDLGAGAVALTTTPTVTVTANTLTVPGNISGVTFGITKAGAGTLSLSGTNTYTGLTTNNAGHLEHVRHV